MNCEEWSATLRNVASDLVALAEGIEQGEEHVCMPDCSDHIKELITDAKLACEYITHEEPHL